MTKHNYQVEFNPLPFLTAVYGFILIISFDIYSQDKSVDHFIEESNRNVDKYRSVVLDNELKEMIYPEFSAREMKEFEELIREGADLGLFIQSGQIDSISSLAIYGDLIGLKKHIESGLYINRRDRLGNTLMHWACLFNHEEMIRFIKENGVNLKIVWYALT